jgi:hypothetical protein
MFNENESTLAAAVAKHFHLSIFDKKATTNDVEQIVSSLQKSGNLYRKIAQLIDFENVRLFIDSDRNKTTAIFKFKETDDKYYSVNGSFNKTGFYLEDELLYGRDKITDENGSVYIIKNNEAIEINYQNGSRSINEVNTSKAEFQIIQATDCQGNHGGTGFCQREAGESYGACYNAETAEFCDSFVSCVALATNPTISVLIGLACSCSARPCP